MPRRLHRTTAPRLLACLALMVWFGPPASAQAPDVDTVLENIKTAADALQDASFTITGRLVDADGTEIPLEVEIQLIPSQQLAGAYIVQPDALADNQIVLDGDVVKNYTFLTNQVTLFDANDPDALGGLLPAGEGGQGSPQISFDIGAIFAGYDAAIADVASADNGNVFTLDFRNKDAAATIATVEALVPASDWLPRSLIFRKSDSSVLAELHADDMRIDQGLDPAEVGYLPQDAEIIDNRGQN